MAVDTVRDILLNQAMALQAHIDALPWVASFASHRTLRVHSLRSCGRMQAFKSQASSKCRHFC